MKFISICSHKVIVNLKLDDVKIIISGLNARGLQLSEASNRYSPETQKELRRIEDMERKLEKVRDVLQSGIDRRKK